MNRKELLDHIEEITDRKIRKAFESVPRESFVLKEYKDKAYEDVALPILSRQTISQPSTVALMTHTLEVKPGNKILEVGTGSGYQAALLSKLAGVRGKIYTIEIIKVLAEFARKNLKDYKNIEIIDSDGSVGLPEKAPFDRIIITAASPKIPYKLIEQLKPAGILVAPVGDRNSQKMIVYNKKENKIKEIGYFVFVPLTGKEGFREG